MSDFTSGFWSIYITLVTISSILGCATLLWLMSRHRPGDQKSDSISHVWDEDLAEYNHPLPAWWRTLFYLTIVVALVYVALYPGLGAFSGMIGWTSAGQYAAERNTAEEAIAPLYAKYLSEDLKLVAADPKARAMGQRLFLNYCAQCHGSDAGGSKGFPNLRDSDWLYGGEPETIKTTIMNGRNGVMPAFGSILGEQGVLNVANYVRSLSGLTHDNLKAAFGKPIFMTNCAACHGPEGKGNQMIGAPNLTDQIWLYGGTEKTVIETITNGRANHMPAHGPILGEGKVQVLAAYVWSLSHQNALDGELSATVK